MIWTFDVDSAKKEEWKVSTEFLHVPNDYQFHTIDLSEKEDISEVPKIRAAAKFPSIRVLLGDYDYNITEIKELENQLSIYARLQVARLLFLLQVEENLQQLIDLKNDLFAFAKI